MSTIEIILRLSLAILIGGAIGYERAFRNSPAGFRTHILVCVGAAIISLIQINMANEAIKIISDRPELAQVIKVDYGRLGAQVISGVGFLGAGTILHTKGSIKGLTTAATLWVVACVGLAIGMGYYEISIFSGVAIVLILVILKRFQNKFISQAGVTKIEIHFLDKRRLLQFLEEYFNYKNIIIKNIEFSINEEEDTYFQNENLHTCLYTVKLPKYMDGTRILNEIILNDNIIKASEIEE